MSVGRIRNHAARARALMTGAFAEKPVVQGTVNVFVGTTQRLEDGAWEVLLTKWLSWGDAARVPYDGEPGEDVIENAQGVQLDTIGALVGEPRDFRTDADYEPAVRLRSLVNNSEGTPDDMLRIARAASPDARIEYHENGGFAYTDAYATVSIAKLPGAHITVNPMDPRAAIVGVEGAPGGPPFEFVCGLAPDPEHCFTWASRFDPSAGDGQWGSHYDTVSTQGLWAYAVRKATG